MPDGTTPVFPGQQRQERIYLIVRRHWVSFVPQTLISLFLALIPFGAFITWRVAAPDVFPPSIPYIIAAIGIWLLLIAAFYIFAWIDYYMDVAIITDERIIDINQHGIFHRSISELSLLRVQDVQASTKGVVQTLFGFGRVDVETAGELPNFVFEARPHPFEIARVILNAHERLVRQTAESGQRDGLGELVPRVSAAPPPISSPPPPTPSPEPPPAPPKPAEQPPKPNLPPAPETNAQTGALKEGETIHLGDQQ